MKIVSFITRFFALEDKRSERKKLRNYIWAYLLWDRVAFLARSNTLVYAWFGLSRSVLRFSSAAIESSDSEIRFSSDYFELFEASLQDEEKKKRELFTIYRNDLAANEPKLRI